MSWLGFLSTGMFWLLAMAVPILIFYFLKLRRPRTEVPSLALWQQVMNDQRVNSPFQKFKRNILLLLQLLLLLALTVAATQPFIQDEAANAEYVPVLIDHSASMAAVEAPGGRSRLDAAKEKVHGLIDNLLADQQLSIIAVGSTAQRLTDFTDNKRLLHEAVDRLEITPVESRLVDGLRITQALTRTQPVERVLLFTDGNVPPDVPFDLPFQLNYRLLPPAGANLGITELNARRAGADSWEVFARVESGTGGSPDELLRGRLEIALDREVLATERVSLPPRRDTNEQESNRPDSTDESSDESSQQRFAVRVESESAGTITARLIPEDFDALAADNSAAMRLPVPRPLVVYCPEALDSFRHALAGMENLEVFPSGEDSGPSEYDLVVSDQESDLDRTAPVALFVGVIPPDLEKLVSTETSLAELVDWKRSEPLLRHVQLAETQISSEPINADGISMEDYENRGYETLAFGGRGPLLLKKAEPAQTAYYFLVHTDLTTLPYRIGFPILVSNLVQETLRSANLLELRAARTGVLEPISLEPETQYNVIGPDEMSVTIQTGENGRLTGVPAPEIGAYEIRQDGDPVATVHANLVSTQETGMKVVEKLQFNEVEVTADGTELPSDKPLWRYFAFAGLALLLTEWWFFHRRPARVV